MQTQIKPTAVLTAREVSLIENLSRQVFGDPGNLYVRSKADWHVLVWMGGSESIPETGDLAGHAEIVVRACAVGDISLRIGGIGQVAVLPEWREHGLASAALQRAQVFISNILGLEFGLLMCDTSLVPFYKRLGWAVVSGPLWFAQPGGKAKLDGVTMVYSCSGRPYPEGSIDLCGLPW